jgi:site-specific DNA recombinase
LNPSLPGITFKYFPFGNPLVSFFLTQISLVGKLLPCQPMRGTTMRAAGYCRVSSQEQIEGTSLKAQENQIRAYAAMKGLELAAVLIDAGVSGGKPLADRPEGSRLAGMIESGEVQAVIITKLDRGFRSASDCLNNVEAWAERNVSVHILNLGGQSIDTSTPTGKFFITVMAGAAELERNLIRERCNEGRRIKKALNCRVGTVPFGFDLQDPSDKKTKQLVANSQEQEVIAFIHLCEAEGLPLRKIAERLNRDGIPTKKGSSWTHKQVALILKRAA